MKIKNWTIILSFLLFFTVLIVICYLLGQKNVDLTDFYAGNDQLVQNEEEVGEKQNLSLIMGEEIGQIRIDVLDIDEPLYYGTDEATLKKGICLTEREGGWELIGEKGRALIACHNYLAFRHLNKIAEDDEITITIGSEEYQYKVIASYESKGTDWNKNAYDATPLYGITLSTCWPYVKGTKDNWIVNCEAVKTY